MRNTKKSLMASVVALLLCFSMLLGATYAWFTDTAISKGNIVQSGNLDAEMYWSDTLLAADSSAWNNADGVPIFTYDNWEPGYTDVKYIKVKNAGNLAFQWRLSIEAQGNVTNLADVIDVYYINPVSETVTTLSDKTTAGVLSSVINTQKYTSGVLLPNKKVSTEYAAGETILAIALHMHEDAGNEYKGKSIGDGFAVRLIATQFNYEGDSFNNKYDEAPEWPDNVTVGGNSASATVETTSDNRVSAAVSLLSSDSVIGAEVPVGVKLNPGVTKLTLNVSDVANSQANVTLSETEASFSVDVHIDGVAEDNDVVMAIGIKELLPVGLNMGNYRFYHVENGQTVAMTLLGDGAVAQHNNYEYDPATGDVVLYLKSFSEVAMIAEPAKWEGNRDYSWYTNAVAPVDGEATADYVIANADQLAGLSAIVGGMDGQTQNSFAGKIVKLIADIHIGDLDSENGYVFYPIGYYNNEGTYEKLPVEDRVNPVSSGLRNFEGIFDGNGHTISDFYQNTWEMKGDHDWYDTIKEQYYRDGMGLFGRVYKGTVKNLTVKNFSSDGEITTTGVIAAYADGATFENIAIFDCNPRVYNIGNGGIVGCVGWYAKEASLKTTFKNITVDNSNKISALWGSYDVACGGIVGQYYPTSGQSSAGKPANAGIHFENCHVSAQMDVYNDVCANYQYYAYRYTGMLIGSVRENVTIDGRSYPKMDGITAEGCTVHFGTWNDYYYCELVANSLASYTHDHQFSRLEQVTSVDAVNMQVTTLKGDIIDIPTSGRYNYVVVNGEHATENATCYHFVDGKVHDHDDYNGDGVEDYETVNGESIRVENNRHIYLEFNNLVTGYGWGVTSKAVGDLAGVTILDREVGDSVDKFEVIKSELTNNRVYKIGDIFAYLENCGVKLVPGALTVTITNLDENGNVSATVEYDRENWENSTISFNNTGNIKITIQDYYFCIPTELTVNITERQPEVKFDVVMNNGDFLHRVGNSGTVALDKLFEAKDGVTVGTISVTVEAVNGTSASGTYSNNAIQFNGTGVVKVTITDNDWCIPTVLYLEVVDATNVTGLSGTISGNVVLLNNCGLSSLTVSGRNTVYGNGFIATYTGNGQYLNNGLKQGVINISENGTLDNLRIKATIYPSAYMYYGKTSLGDYVQGGPSSVEGDKTRYHYQLSAVAASGNATISNCYIYGGRNNIFVNTGDVTIKDTVLECGVVANVQIQSNASHTITFENVTTIQYQVNPTIGDTTKVMLGAGILVGPETTENPTIVLNGEFKQYNWVTAEDKEAASDEAVKKIIEGALNATAFNHTVNGKTASNLGIIYMNDYEVKVTNNTGLPYVVGEVSISGVTGTAYSLQGATESQIYSDYANADKSTVNGLYQPQFKYPADLGGQKIDKTDDGDEFLYREGDTIHVMFPSGDSKEIDLAALVNIVKYSGQNLNLVVTCKDENGNAVTVADGKITLSAAGEYTVTYTVTDTLFFDKDGKQIINDDSKEYSWDVTISVSLKDTAVPDAYFEFDNTKQKMGYYKPTFGDVKQYLPFLAGLKIYDHNGQTPYLRFDGDADFNKIASITITGYTSNEAYIEVKLTDGGVINTKFLARADSGGGSTYTGKIKTSNNTVYFVSDSGTSNKEATTTAAYWYVDYYKFTGNNGVAIQSAQQTFNSTGSSASTPSGNFSTTIKYTVTYDANNGNCGQATGYATSASEAVTLPTPTRSGYIFAGWYTAASGGTRVGGAGDSYTPTANVTLYAQWGKPCTVTYNANGGSCGTASEKYTGTALTLPACTRDGYWFAGWYDAAEGGNKIGDAGATYNPSGEITLYAHWQEKIEYTVTYNANGGSCGTASATYQGTAMTLPTPTQTGHKFLGWYTAASGGNKVGDAGASYTPTANITLYAQWIAQYTVTYNANSGSVSPSSATVDAGSSVTLPTPTRSGYTFNGWYTASSGGTKVGNAGVSYTPTANITLYAQWSSSCVTGDTLVTLADGTQKHIDELTLDDKVLAWDFFTGSYVAKDLAFLVNHGEAFYQIANLVFSDGTTLRIIGDHGVFDYDLNKYVYFTVNNMQEYVGHRFVQYAADGTYNIVTLVEAYETEEYTSAWSITSVDASNAFASGLLTVGPPADFYNWIEMGDKLMYNVEQFAQDVETYGLYTYDDFKEYLTYEQFVNWNGAYLKIAVEKGYFTFDYILELIEIYGAWMV